MSLPPPPKVQKLQEALHAKAKGSPDYRFYALYDKVFRKDILEWAYVRCRANDGAPGVDRQTFEDIEAYGLDRWLDELAADLKAKTYRPQPVRRVEIPKEDGTTRPLGISCTEDKIVQEMTRRILEAIYEPLFLNTSYGFRPGRKREGHGVLSAREMSVAFFVANGKTNAEIGELLHVSSRTVEYHIGNILSKCGLRSRVEIAAKIAAGGSLDPAV